MIQENLFRLLFNSDDASHVKKFAYENECFSRQNGASFWERLSADIVPEMFASAVDGNSFYHAKQCMQSKCIFI